MLREETSRSPGLRAVPQPLQVRGKALRGCLARVRLSHHPTYEAAFTAHTRRPSLPVPLASYLSTRRTCLTPGPLTESLRSGLVNCTLQVEKLA